MCISASSYEQEQKMVALNGSRRYASVIKAMSINSGRKKCHSVPLDSSTAYRILLFSDASLYNFWELLMLGVFEKFLYTNKVTQRLFSK
jgi:hypothetical protein